MLDRETYKLRQTQKGRLGEKFLVKKKCLILKPFMTTGNTTVEGEERDYYLNVYADNSTKTLIFHLFDCEDGGKYDVEASYDHIETRQKNINKTYNIRILDEYCESIIKRLYIVDHLLLLRDEKEKGGELDKGSSGI